MNLNRWPCLAALLAWGALACKGKESQAPSSTERAGTPSAPSASSAPSAPSTPSAPAAGHPGDKPAPARPAVEQVAPPVDLKVSPPDATKLPSGMIFKKLTTSDGPLPGRNDTVEVHFTGWKVASGETFNTTRTRGTPMPLDLASAGPGFVDVFTQVRKGEKVMMWMPAELVGKNGQGVAEALAFEAEVVNILPAPQVPADVAAPPAAARTTRGGVRYVALTKGAGAERPRSFDTATFRYTLWDSSGRMLSSTEKRGRPVSSTLFRQPRVFEDVIVTMVAGQRVRFWVDAAKVEQLEKMVKVAGEPPKGLLCYELELTEIVKGTAPPATPKDVKAPPAGTKKTEAGVFYRVLRPGKGKDHPKASDSVRVHYTGWTTDGRLFDSSIVRGEPTTFQLSGVIRGWTEGIPQMVVGDVARFWIPEELAYKNSPGQPQGMLVFDVELLEITAAPAGGNPHAPNPHGAHDGHGH